MPEEKKQPVSPDSVHVWRGYMAPGKDWSEFAEFLGGVFLPTGALLQPRAGLHAFFPSMPGPSKSYPGVPDQTALMFWVNPGAHENGFKTVAVRAYTNLHGGAYGPPSSAQFPIPFQGKLQSEQPYYLKNEPADWMYLKVKHLLAAPKKGSDILSVVQQWATKIQITDNAIEGALVCASEKYVAAWVALEQNESDLNPLEALAAETNPVLNQEAEIYTIPAGLWDDWAGIDLTKGTSCLNIQLERP